MSDEDLQVQFTTLMRGVYKKFQYVFFAAAGSVLVGVTIPVLLVCWHNSKEVTDQLRLEIGQPAVSPLFDRLYALTSLEAIATMFCGPGAVVLSILLYTFTLKRLGHNSPAQPKREPESHELLWVCMWRGALISFLNFPGLLSFVLVGDNGVMQFVRFFLLFVVAGATCGAWTGWQVYRHLNPTAPFFPRYRLSTLLGLVFAWAVLLAIFAPSSHS